MSQFYNYFKENFPQIYASMLSSYNEDYFAYENSPKISANPHFKRSRNAVKRSAKRSSASKNRHKLERLIEFPMTFPDRDKILVIRLTLDELSGEIFAKTNIGEFCIKPVTFDDKIIAWQAVFKNRRVTAKNPFLALARLLGKTWGTHIYSGQEISIYDLYKSIFFDFESAKKKPRNNTLTFRASNEFRMFW